MAPWRRIEHFPTSMGWGKRCALQSGPHAIQQRHLHFKDFSADCRGAAFATWRRLWGTGQLEPREVESEE